jgi:pre-mRNA-splicing factor ATP-dependent RNA helicase DHX16
LPFRQSQEELRDDIMDEEYLFDQSQLTERERRDLEYKKKVFSLAQEHVKAGDMEKVDRWVVSVVT